MEKNLTEQMICVSVCLLTAGYTHTDTHTYALGATSGASDYAVKPNQFPVFGLMDAIIFTDLKQVSMPPPPPPPQHNNYSGRHTFMSTTSEKINNI